MKTLYILLFALLFVTACENDLDQFPENVASADSLTEFEGILNAAYFYNRGSVTPLAVMGDFRADNAVMDEDPYDQFDKFGPDLTNMEEQFFGPFYTALYKSILSSNTVIEKSEDDVEVGEAKFLRGLAYFKLVKVFGPVSLNLSSTPSATDEALLTRRPTSEIYAQIIQDLSEARDALSATITNGRASKLAAQGMLGKVHMQMGNFSSAATELQAVVDGAGAANIRLLDSFPAIFGEKNDLNAEIIFATQISSSITDEYVFSEFSEWSGGLDTKSLRPLDQDLIDAFDEVAGAVLDPTVGDIRRAVTINEALKSSPKFPQDGGADHDFIELRLADVILLLAEANNENGASAGAVLGLLDPIRKRAGLAPLDPGTINSQAMVRQAIADERRMELAFEGHRWFDLVRTGTVNAEMGQQIEIDPKYYLFPIPESEILASSNIITQNDGY